MDSFSDPDCLHHRVGIPFHEETRRLPSEEFESATDRVDSHAVVGITNEEGDVLLMNDGSHGWTLIAVTIERGQDWPTVARQETEALLDASVVFEGVELVRRVDFRSADDDTQCTSMYSVVFSASINDDTGIDTEKHDNLSLRWSEGAPDEQEGDVADDIRLFVEN